jgi:hypothetical protein
MNISNFIVNNKINQVVNSDVKKLLDEALYYLEKYASIDSKNGIKDLDDLEDEVILNAEQIIKKINQSTAEIIKSSYFHLRDKSDADVIASGNKIKFNLPLKNKVLNSDDFVSLHHPLILCIQQLIAISEQLTPSLNNVICASRLLQAFLCNEMIWEVSILWSEEYYAATYASDNRENKRLNEQKYDKAKKLVKKRFFDITLGNPQFKLENIVEDILLEKEIITGDSRLSESERFIWQDVGKGTITRWVNELSSGVVSSS